MFEFSPYLRIYRLSHLMHHSFLLVQRNKCCNTEIFAFQKINALLSSFNRVNDDIVELLTCGANRDIILFVDCTEITLELTRKISP